MGLYLNYYDYYNGRIFNTPGTPVTIDTGENRKMSIGSFTVAEEISKGK